MNFNLNGLKLNICIAAFLRLIPFLPMSSDIADLWHLKYMSDDYVVFYPNHPPTLMHIEVYLPTRMYHFPLHCMNTVRPKQWIASSCQPIYHSKHSQSTGRQDTLNCTWFVQMKMEWILTDFIFTSLTNI